jgi:hypothetical protein
VVVDLAIKYDPKCLVFIADWLVTSANVDDAETAHRQSDVLLNENAIIIWPAVDDLAVHRQQRVAANVARPIRMENAANSTHN